MRKESGGDRREGRKGKGRSLVPSAECKAAQRKIFFAGQCQWAHTILTIIKAPSVGLLQYQCSTVLYLSNFTIAHGNCKIDQRQYSTVPSIAKCGVRGCPLYAD